MKLLNIAIIILLLILNSCNNSQEEVSQDLFSSIIVDIIDIDRYFGQMPTPNKGIFLNDSIEKVLIEIKELENPDLSPTTLEYIGYQDEHHFFSSFSEVRNYNYFNIESIDSLYCNNINVVFTSGTKIPDINISIGHLMLSEVWFNKEFNEGVLEFLLMYETRGGVKSFLFIRKEENKWNKVKEIVVAEF